MIARPVIYKTLRKIEKHAIGPVAAVCLYESAAIVAKQPWMPTVSQLAHRHKATALAAAAVLGLHIWFYDG